MCVSKTMCILRFRNGDQIGLFVNKVSLFNFNLALIYFDYIQKRVLPKSQKGLIDFLGILQLVMFGKSSIKPLQISDFIVMLLGLDKCFDF